MTCLAVEFEVNFFLVLFERLHQVALQWECLVCEWYVANAHSMKRFCFLLNKAPDRVLGSRNTSNTPVSFLVPSWSPAVRVRESVTVIHNGQQNHTIPAFIVMVIGFVFFSCTHFKWIPFRAPRVWGNPATVENWCMCSANSCTLWKPFANSSRVAFLIASSRWRLRQDDTGSRLNADIFLHRHGWVWAHGASFQWN